MKKIILFFKKVWFRIFKPDCYICFNKKRKKLMKEFVYLCHHSDILLIEEFLNELDEEELTALWLKLSTNKDPNLVGLYTIYISILAVITAVLIPLRSEALTGLEEEYNKWIEVLAPRIEEYEKLLPQMMESIQEWAKSVNWLGLGIIFCVLLSIIIFVWLNCYLHNMRQEQYAKEIVRIYREGKSFIRKEEKSESVNKLPSKYKKILEINNDLKTMKRKRAVKQE